MDGSLFFDGQDITPDDLNNIETTKQFAIKQRTVDLSVHQGIVVGLVATSPSALVISVTPGTAYDVNGEYITIPQPNPVTVPFTGPSDVGSYVVIFHTNTQDTQVLHPVTGTPNNTRQHDGFQLAIVPSGSLLSTHVKLAQITAVSGGNIATLDASVADYWGAVVAPNSIHDTALVQSDPVIQHVYHGFGTGTVTSTNVHGLAPVDIGVVDNVPIHEELEHTTGIEVGSNYFTAAFAAVDAGPNPDQVTVIQPAGSDSILIYGTRLTAATTISPLVVTFADASLSVPELYEINLSSAGAVSKHRIASYSAARLILGVELVDVDTNGANTAGNITYVNNGSGVLSLQWRNGPIQILSASGVGDRFYHLYDELGTFIDVWVNYAALLGAGTYTDTITPYASVGITAGNMQLATVPWNPNGTLGYGANNTSGLAYDKRPFGNLGPDQINTKFRQEIDNRTADAGGDGWVTKFDLATGPGPLQFTMRPGKAYINGLLYSFTNEIFDIHDNDTVFVWVDQFGQFQFTLTDPQIIYGQGPVPFVRIAKVVTSSGSIIHLIDQRTIMGQNIQLGLKDYGSISRSCLPSRRSVINAFGGVLNSRQAYTLLDEYPTLYDFSIRVYGEFFLNSPGANVVEYIIVSNAYWDPINLVWVQENSSANSSAYAFNNNQNLSLWKVAGASPWAFNGWEVPNAFDPAHNSLHLNPSTARPNLASNIGLTNEIASILIVKAWAQVQVSAGVASLLDGANVSGVTLLNADLFVDLVNGITGSGLALVSQSNHLSGSFASAGLSSGNTVQVNTYNSSGVLINPFETTICNYHVLVMGRQ